MGRRTLPAGALPGTTAAPAPAPAPAPGTPRAEPGPSDSPADGTAPGSRALRFVSRHGPADTDAFRKDGPLTPGATSTRPGTPPWTRRSPPARRPRRCTSSTSVSPPGRDRHGAAVRVV
ncbi:hypothetical protein SUDANB132_00743 [Streptomyces sp. enrichment culture]